MFGRVRIPLAGGIPGPILKGGRAEVFAAYPYHFEGYRDMLVSLEQSALVHFTFADDDLSAQHLINKIGRQLSNCSIAIFDLTGWNPNVAFEFGIVVGNVGMNLQNVLLLLNPTSENSDVPSDLQGLAQVRYQSLEDLRSKLAKHLSGKFPLPKPSTGTPRR